MHRNPVSGTYRRWKGRWKVFLSAWSVMVALPFLGTLPAPAAETAKPAPPRAASERKSAADSLHALRLIISSELKPGNEVLRLEEPGLSDSLLRRPEPRSKLMETLRDSTRARSIRDPEEFKAYWDRLERENGIKAIKDQMGVQDVDKSRIPHAYLFDSTMVVYPGWIILRRR